MSNHQEEIARLKSEIEKLTAVRDLLGGTSLRLAAWLAHDFGLQLQFPDGVL